MDFDKWLKSEGKKPDITPSTDVKSAHDFLNVQNFKETVLSAKDSCVTSIISGAIAATTWKPADFIFGDMKITNKDGKVEISGNLNQGGRMLAYYLWKTGFGVDPIQPEESGDEKILIAQIDVDGATLSLPVKDLERPGGMIGLAKMLGSSTDIKMSMVWMTRDAYSKLGEFDAW